MINRKKLLRLGYVIVFFNVGCAFAAWPPPPDDAPQMNIQK